MAQPRALALLLASSLALSPASGFICQNWPRASVAQRGEEAVRNARSSAAGRLWSTSDDTFPSDTSGPDSGMGAIPCGPVDLEQREKVKAVLLQLAALSNRGQLATDEEKSEASDLVYQLEAMNETPMTSDFKAISGTWELVLTDTQLFRSSPFFMALGELFGEDRARAETAFALHRAATSNGEIGRVRQTISDNELVSELDLSVGILSGLPFALKGTVVTKAALNPLSADTFGVTVQSTTVKNSNVAPFLDGSVELPLETLYSSLRGGVPEVKLSTFYLDDQMRISRTPDEHFFVYMRA